MAQVSPRKTPVQGRSAATVRCVLDAAARILEDDGLGGLNTNAVARRAGISIGSLYQYFPGKDAIISALILRAHETIVLGLRRLLAETEAMPPRDAIGAMLDMLFRVEAPSPRLSRILDAEEARLTKTDAILAAEREIDALNRSFFARYVDPARCTDAQLSIAATEVILIVRSMLDAPPQPDDLDRSSLRNRIQRTMEGYLAPLLRQDD